MKSHYYSLLICIFCMLNSYGQNLTVHIKSVKQNLPFSSVLINGAYHSVADSTGMALIPEEQLKIGDTISARYVGAQDASEIFKGQNEMTLDLPGLEIDSIVVLSNAKRRDLWRNINQHKIRKANQKIIYCFEIYKNSDTTKVSSGNADCWFHSTSGYDLRGSIYHLKNDASLNKPVLELTKHIINDAFVNMVFKKWVTTNKGIQIMKEDNDNYLDVYTIIRPAIIGEELMNESTKIFVDPATKDVTQTVVLSEFKTFSMLCTANYHVIENYYVPFQIECTIKYREGNPRILNYRIFDLKLLTKRDRKTQLKDTPCKGILQ